MKLSHLIFSTTAMLLAENTIAAGAHKGHNNDDKQNKTHAHEVKAMYGGIVTEMNDINYELIAKPDSITIYISDHGKPVDTKGATATITLLSSSDKTDVMLTPAGENKLAAKGVFKTDAGTKAIAKITLAGKPLESIRFTLK